MGCLIYAEVRVCSHKQQWEPTIITFRHSLYPLTFTWPPKSGCFPNFKAKNRDVSVQHPAGGVEKNCAFQWKTMRPAEITRFCTSSSLSCCTALSFAGPDSHADLPYLVGV